APDAVQIPGAKGQKGRKNLAPPTEAEYGAQYEKVKQVHTDRAAILSLMEKLPASERQLLPDIVETTEGLYARALDLGKTLNEMDQNFGKETPDRIRRQLDELSGQPDSEERSRRIRLLEQQVKTATELMSRRQSIADRIESSVLAMQNVRFDLIRLRSAGVNAVLGDITQATQQARALSRDVENLIAAAGEIKEAMG
ncbi:MAG: hypothetical protein ABI647_17055, partial [Gemmatimonadota bacterium]